jgi:hypothetical protein
MEKKETYFSDKQVSLIIKRALELQKKDSKSLQDPGLTPTDLEKIALEAGIDREYIQKAISEVKEGSLKGSKSALEKFLGNKHRIILKQEIPVEIPVEKYENFLPIIQKATHISGNHSLIGNTFTWGVSDYQTGQNMHIMITSKEGKTKVEVESNLGQVAGGLFGGLMGGVGGGVGFGVGFGVGIGAMASFLFALLFPLGTLGVSYLLARIIFNTVSKSSHKKLKRLMKEIVKEIESK